MSHDVFLSYASSDRAAADQVCAALESRGVRCWMAPRNVLPGEDWGMAILAAIAAARCMVVVHSASTGNSVHVRNEVVTATSQRLAIVPVRVDEAPPGGALRLHLAAWHWLTACPPPIAAHTDSLVMGVRASFADSDATVNLAIRRPGPPQPVAAAAPVMRPSQPAPPPMPAPAASPARMVPRPAPPQARPMPPVPQAQPAPPFPAAAPSRRASPLALLVIGGSMLVVAGLAAWFLALGPGRAWLPLGRATESLIQVATASESPQSLILIPIAAEPTPMPGGPAVVPTPSPEASPPPPVPPPGPGPSGPVQGGAGGPPPSSLDTVEPRAPPRSSRQQAAQPPPQQPPPQQQNPPPRPALVVVHNTGQQDIEQLFVSPVADTNWGSDWLGMAQITPGNRVLVPRPPERGCLFDLRVVWRDRSVEELRRQDLCATTEYRFDGSKAHAAGGGR